MGVKLKTNLKSLTLFKDRFFALCLLSSIPILLTLYGISVAFLPTGSKWYSNSIWLIAFFERYMFEVLLLIVLLRILASLNRMPSLGYVVLATSLTLLVIQGCSLIVGSEFLSPLAVENLFHSDFVLGTFSYLVPLGIVGFWVVTFMVITRLTNPRIWRRRTTSYSLGILLLALILDNASNILPHELQDNKDKIFQRVGLEHTGALQHIAYLLKRDVKRNGNIDPDQLSILNSLGIKINPENKYPFVRNKIYKDPSPLRNFGLDVPRKPNIVLLFTEGMSARSIGSYNPSLDQLSRPLTPRISEFSGNGIFVTNYWNHTAASYRGMRGQLCSMYPINDGTEPFQGRPDLVPPTYFCITHALQEIGYKTFFVNAHIKKSSFLDEIMPPLGFDKMINGEELSTSYLGGDKPAHEVSLSDSQFFDALYNEIASHESRPNESPFFIAAYNLGTHAFFNVARGELRYGDGKNNALNTIHNFDFQFGKFWEKFQKLAIANQTIFIFTTDHCHYAEKSFVRVFDAPDYQRQFIDKIPFIIQIPGLKRSIQYDAHHATSASLAASIAHLLELPNLPTPWVAGSIFDKQPGTFPPGSLAGYVDHRYMILGDQINRLSWNGQSDQKKDAINSFFDLSILLEQENRIWDPSLRRLEK